MSFLQCHLTFFPYLTSPDGQLAPSPEGLEVVETVSTSRFTDHTVVSSHDMSQADPGNDLPGKGGRSKILLWRLLLLLSTATTTPSHSAIATPTAFHEAGILRALQHPPPKSPRPGKGTCERERPACKVCFKCRALAEGGRGTSGRRTCGATPEVCDQMSGAHRHLAPPPHLPGIYTGGKCAQVHPASDVIRFR